MVFCPNLYVASMHSYFRVGFNSYQKVAGYLRFVPLLLYPCTFLSIPSINVAHIVDSWIKLLMTFFSPVVSSSSSIGSFSTMRASLEGGASWSVFESQGPMTRTGGIFQ